MSEERYVCDPDTNYLIDKLTGEVLDQCFEITDVVEDHDLEHYSVTPPVPYVPTKIKERMKETNKWIKGREKYLEIKMKLYKAIEFILANQ